MRLACSLELLWLQRLFDAPATVDRSSCALFACLISRTFSDNEQYFFLTTNQPIVLLVMAYQPSEQVIYLHPQPAAAA